MRQYELAIRIAQVHHLVDERKYKKALAVIQTLDMRQVRALSDLRVFAEVYTKTEQYDAAKATYLRIYRRSHTKRVLYRLIYLSIRTNALNDAEAYYQEFVRMNPNMRDALILRYRIDKAAGEPIGRLIEILQELKQEEYIEEWAYELAKLYHRAGRKEDCKDECQDIILWFGTGEIVERAKILIEHLEEKDGDLYYDDRDFTVPKKEEPNPEDTGSLPDLNEFVKGRKARRMAERREESSVAGKEQETAPADGETEEKKFVQAAESAGHGRQKPFPAEDFVDDYQDDDFEEEMDLSQKAKDGIHKLSGLLKLGKKEESVDIPVQEPPERDAAGEQQKERHQDAFPGKSGEGTSAREQMTGEDKPSMAGKPEGEEQVKIGFVPHSQSGMGITQDLAKEIAAIYEMEQKEQLKEKTVTVIQDTSNLAANVVERMTQAVQKNIGKTYIPLDIEEIQPEGKAGTEGGLFHKTVEEEIQPSSEEDIEDKVSEVPSREKIVEESQKASLKEYGEGVSGDINEEEMRERALTKMIEEEVAEIQKNISRETEADSQKNVSEEEVTETNRQDTETLKGLLEEEIDEPEPQASATMDELVAPEIKSVEPNVHPVTEEPLFLEQEVSHEEDSALPQREMEIEEASVPAEQEMGMEEASAPNQQDMLTEEVSVSKEQVSGLAGYQAPDIPVVETSFMEMPEITYDELPTTRALQQSFQNVLKLIAGERDPSHFVLMGDGRERVVGVSKQIVRVMKEAGYLTQGRIAKIHAGQINKMDLISFRSQLKGNCLLVEGASDLLFPTITRLFSIMEEYYGDFVVILVDEGTTLDQLFRFVPALAKKFKYIIDISNYTPEDYQ